MQGKYVDRKVVENILYLRFSLRFLLLCIYLVSTLVRLNAVQGMDVGFLSCSAPPDE